MKNARWAIVDNRSAEFSEWDVDHLNTLRTGLVFGHAYYEKVGEYDAEGYWRLRKLGARMPKTITDIKVESDGGLKWIKQNLGRSIADKELRVVYKAVMRHTEPKVYVMHRRAVSEKQLAEING